MRRKGGAAGLLVQLPLVAVAMLGGGPGAVEAGDGDAASCVSMDGVDIDPHTPGMGSVPAANVQTCCEDERAQPHTLSLTLSGLSVSSPF